MITHSPLTPPLTLTYTMAHLLNNTAIFSPSVARAAASAAKDWSYIDTWLARKFPSNRPPPPFERNADTLKALLALAAANEAADEERALLLRFEAETLAQLQKHQPKDDLLTTSRESILTSLEDSLTREGSTALTSLAQLSLQLNSSPSPNPVSLASELLSLQSQLAELEQTLARIDVLTSYISSESEALSKLSSEIDARPRPSSSHSEEENNNNNLDDNSNTATKKSEGYHPHPSLAKSNLAAQRRIKTLAARVQELFAHASPNPSADRDQSVSIQEIHAQEQAYLRLLQQKKELDAQLAGFAGLPHDIDAAREELENLRIELTRVTERRDSVFEGLVERETPKKGRSGTIGRR
ncbi:hypothetical protein QC761_505850 [Podospora bellae-mahoneyi]|uniref:Uncharacterized protein n=1 Tax=Podospora bellae-mahoneyi TaxID=2093777 RepID=A0ABR0FDF4_9PEZI|nr:hypothetical protein QC761_505850 [Podospora bellae-mahoneyi]